MFTKKTFAAALCAVMLPLAPLAPAFAATDAPAGPGPAAHGHGAKGDHGPMGHHGHGGPMGDLSFLQGVTLTPAQQGQIHQIMRADFGQARPAMQQLRADHRKMADLLASTARVDQSSLADMQQHDSQLIQQLQAQHLSTVLKIRALLTPEQLQQSATAHQQLASLRQQRDAILHKSWGDRKPTAE